MWEKPIIENLWKLTLRAHGLQVCVEEILYYNCVYTSDFFIDSCHSRSTGHSIVHSIFVNIVQESQGVFVHIHMWQSGPG